MAGSGQRVDFSGSHFGMLTDRSPFDRVLATGAETRLVRGQKERHGCDFFDGAHSIEGRHFIARLLHLRRLFNSGFENIRERRAGMDRITPDVESLVGAVNRYGLGQANHTGF